MLKKTNLDVLIVELLLFDELELFDGLALDHGDAILLPNLAILRFLDHVLKSAKIHSPQLTMTNRMKSSMQVDKNSP